MLTVKQTEKFEVGNGAHVVIRGFTAREQAQLSVVTKQSEGDDKQLTASMECCLGVVSGGAGFQRYKTGSDTEIEDVPAAEITGEWLLDNLPLHICEAVSARVIKLSAVSKGEKKT